MVVPGSTGPLQGFAIKCVVRAQRSPSTAPRQGIYIKRIENRPLSSLSPRHQMYRPRPCYRAPSPLPRPHRCALSPFPRARPRRADRPISLSIAALAAGRTPSFKTGMAVVRSAQVGQTGRGRPPRNAIKYARRDVKETVTVRGRPGSHPETTSKPVGKRSS